MQDFVRTPLLTVAVLAITLALSPANANIYKHIDANGNVSFSDKPAEGAKEVKIPGVRSSKRSSSNNEDESEEYNEGSELDEEGSTSPNYRSLAILTPREGKVVESGAIQVILLPTPSLGEDDELVITIDGKDISKGRDVNVSIKNLLSGKHTVSGRILDAGGKVLMESTKVGFQIGK